MLRCKICNSEMEYVRVKPLNLVHIGDFGCTGNDVVRTYYKCKCGTLYEKSKWSMGGKNGMTEKQKRFIYIIINNLRGQEHKLHKEAQEEYENLLSKVQAYCFIKKYLPYCTRS